VGRRKKRKITAKINFNMVSWITAVAVMACGIGFFTGTELRKYAAVVVILAVVLLLVNILMSAVKRRITAGRIMQMPFYRDSKGNSLAAVRDFNLPMVFIDENGDAIWYNDPFKELFNSVDPMKKVHSIKRTIKELFLLQVRARLIMEETSFSMDVDFNGKSFFMQGVVLDSCIMLYFVDITEFQKLKRKTEDSAMAVGVVVMDSYEEIYQSDGEAVVNQVSAELGKMFDRWLADKHAVIRKLIRDRYILLIEKQYLRDLEIERFSILDEAKKISVGNRSNVTLSMGISLNGEHVDENFKHATEACELALGRGGDQVIIREDSGDTYYGGSSVEIERRTKVKARVIANLLKDEIEKSSNVLIMGHSAGDMDALGASLSVYRACCVSGKPARIVLNKSNQSIELIMKKLNALPEYAEVFVNTSDALNLMDDGTLVVVVDTYKQALTEAPKVLDYASRVAVIDHHRRGADFIRDTVLFYSETYASSTSELMVEILGYYASNITLPKIEAEAMYAGIWVDTKSFTFKTGIRTFEAASFLRSQGVDTVEVRRYFQPDYETFSQVCNVTATSEIINGNIAIAICGPDIVNPQFIAALSADQLLTISEIDASFVLSAAENYVYVSGRSLGDINVQVILEKMGGGGHLTAAGTKVEDSTVVKVKRELIRHIEEVIK
jgi:c-di-AMP phosphodiesterase-like protein